MRILPAFILALSAACALPQTGHAQAQPQSKGQPRHPVPAAPADVSDLRVGAYKIGVDKGCRDAGLRAQDPPPKVAAFCDCVKKFLTTTVSQDEWRLATYHSLRNERPRELRVLQPYLDKVDGACRPKQ